MALNPKYKIRHINAPVKNAITAFDVRPEHHVLIDAKTEASKTNPIYDPVIPPVSIVPVADNESIVYTYKSVGISAINTTASTAKYLPKTICHFVRGRVCRISNVPVLYSSAKLRIAKAGIRKINIHGDNSKNLSSVAYPKSKILLSFKMNR